MIKKILGLAAMATIFSSGAYAGTITDAASITLGDSGVSFSCSTSVEIETAGTTVAYTLVSKHVAGGTTAYAVTESATGIGIRKELAADLSATDAAGTLTAGEMPANFTL